MGSEIRILLKEPTDAIISLGALSALVKKHDGTDILDHLVRRYERVWQDLIEYNDQASQFFNEWAAYLETDRGDFASQIEGEKKFHGKREELFCRRSRIHEDVKNIYLETAARGYIPHKNYDEYYREEFMKFCEASTLFEEYVNNETVGVFPESGMVQVEKASMRSAIKKINEYLKT